MAAPRTKNLGFRNDAQPARAFLNPPVSIVNPELHENAELAWPPPIPPSGGRRISRVGRCRAGVLQLPSRTPFGEPRATAPTGRSGSFGVEAEADQVRSAPLGAAMRSLERLAIRPRHRQAGDRHCMAPEGLSVFPGVECPPRPARAAGRFELRPRTDP